MPTQYNYEPRWKALWQSISRSSDRVYDFVPLDAHTWVFLYGEYATPKPEKYHVLLFDGQTGTVQRLCSNIAPYYVRSFSSYNSANRYLRSDSFKKGEYNCIPEDFLKPIPPCTASGELSAPYTHLYDVTATQGKDTLTLESFHSPAGFLSSLFKPFIAANPELRLTKELKKNARAFSFSVPGLYSHAAEKLKEGIIVHCSDRAISLRMLRETL